MVAYDLINSDCVYLTNEETSKQQQALQCCFTALQQSSLTDFIQPLLLMHHFKIFTETNNAVSQHCKSYS